MYPARSFLPSGTEVQYYSVCHTKLWLFSHYIRMEDNSDDVLIGRVIHEDSFRREHKEIIIDGKVALDFVKTGGKLVIHEIKKDYKLVEVHRIQIRYYLWYVRHILGIGLVEGIIDYPSHKMHEEVILTEEDEVIIPDMITRINEIVHQPDSPSPKKIRVCLKCAYFEFCWV